MENFSKKLVSKTFVIVLYVIGGRNNSQIFFLVYQKIFEMEWLKH